MSSSYESSASGWAPTRQMGSNSGSEPDDSDDTGDDDERNSGSAHASDGDEDVDGFGGEYESTDDEAAEQSAADQLIRFLTTLLLMRRLNAKTFCIIMHYAFFWRASANVKHTLYIRTRTVQTIFEKCERVSVCMQT